MKLFTVSTSIIPQHIPYRPVEVRGTRTLAFTWSWRCLIRSEPVPLLQQPSWCAASLPFLVMKWALIRLTAREGLALSFD